MASTAKGVRDRCKRLIYNAKERYVCEWRNVVAVRTHAHLYTNREHVGKGKENMYLCTQKVRCPCIWCVVLCARVQAEANGARKVHDGN